MDLGLKDVAEIALKWVDEHLTFRYFFMLFLLSIAFLVGINPLLAYLGLPLIPPSYRVGAAALTLVFGVGSLFFLIEKGMDEYRETSRLSYVFSHLSEAEEAVLRNLTDGKQNSVVAWEHQPGIAELWANRVIERRPDALPSGLSVYILSPKARRMYISRAKGLIPVDN